MCGRFALATEKKVLEMLYDLELREDLAPRFNIAPSQKILAIRFLPDSGNTEAAFLKWGLVPFWADDPAIGNRMINARSETAPQKPSFRDAFKKRRILIPASGFYEWKKSSGGKQPYFISRNDGLPFSLAGLWERWSKGEEPLETCTILTTEPNALVAPIHNRMPVIISREAHQKWLSPETDQEIVAGLLKPYPADQLTAYQVSRRVNSPAEDSAELIQPQTPQT